MWAVVQMLKKIKVDRGDVLYRENDCSEELYYIKQGKVKLFTEVGIHYLTLKDGDQFGDEELLFNESRKSRAVAITDCMLYTLLREDLELVLDQYREVKGELLAKMKSKRDELEKIRAVSIKRW